MKALRAAAVATAFVAAVAAIVTGLCSAILFIPHPWGFVAVLGFVAIFLWAGIFAAYLGSHP